MSQLNSPAGHIAQNIDLLQLILQTLSELATVSDRVLLGGVGEAQLDKVQTDLHDLAIGQQRRIAELADRFKTWRNLRYDRSIDALIDRLQERQPDEPVVRGLPAEVEPREWWLGDPGYLFNTKELDEAWQSFCRQSEGLNYGIFSFDGHDIPWSSTLYGDGQYPVLIGLKKIGRVSVDSGTIAAVPTALLEKLGAMERLKKLGVVYSIGGRLIFAEGRLQIGRLTIDSSDEAEEDED